MKKPWKITPLVFVVLLTAACASQSTPPTSTPLPEPKVTVFPTAVPTAAPAPTISQARLPVQRPVGGGGAMLQDQPVPEELIPKDTLGVVVVRNIGEGFDLTVDDRYHYRLELFKVEDGKAFFSFTEEGFEPGDSIKIVLPEGGTKEVAILLDLDDSTAQQIRLFVYLN